MRHIIISAINNVSKRRKLLHYLFYWNASIKQIYFCLCDPNHKITFRIYITTEEHNLVHSMVPHRYVFLSLVIYIDALVISITILKRGFSAASLANCWKHLILQLYSVFRSPFILIRIRFR